MSNIIDEHQQSITNEGRKAYHDGIERDENPYDQNTPEHELWSEGHKAAARNETLNT